MVKNLVRTIIYAIMLLAFFSCAKKTPGSAFDMNPEDFLDSDFVDENTENVLLMQVLHGYQCEAVYDDSVKYTFKEADMLALGDVLAQEMTKMGLELNPDLFLEQIDKTHGVKICRPCYYSLTEKRMQLYMVYELFAPQPKFDFNINLSKSRYNRIEDVIFDPRVGLLYPALFLPEVLDYKVLYPEIKKAEDMAVMPNVNGEKVKKWSEEPTVALGRAEILKMVYHVNNYVLYKNLESLNWLVTNCMSVLQSMFVDFHMEHEPVIDSLVLVRTRSGEARLESLFAERNEDGSIYIRTGLLDYISKNERLKAPRFQSTIRQYVAGCFGHDIYYDRMERFPKVLTDNFTLEERRFIVANVMNTAFSLYSGADYGKIMNIIIDKDPGFIDHVVKKRYYGFSNLRMGISLYRMRFRAEKWKVITPASN